MSKIGAFKNAKSPSEVIAASPAATAANAEVN
jgi:hypothetical protein